MDLLSNKHACQSGNSPRLKEASLTTSGMGIFAAVQMALESRIGGRAEEGRRGEQLAPRASRAHISAILGASLLFF